MPRNFGTFLGDTRERITARISALRLPVDASASTEPLNQSHSFMYEELLKGCVPCPTCRGCGKVTPELEAQLVSFLPVNDHRLNPRTKLKVCAALALCVLVASLTIAFLLPRSLTLTANHQQIVPFKFQKNEKISFIHMEISYNFTIHNTNYYPIKLMHATLDGVFDKGKISRGQNKSIIWVSMRSKYEHYINMNITFTSERKGGILYCEYAGHIPMELDLGVTAEYLGHTQQLGLANWVQIQCSQNSQLMGI